MKLFNTNNIWTSLIIVDNILMLNCLVLSGLIVSEGLRKSSPNVTIFFLQIFSVSSMAYIYLLVKFLFCLFFCFFATIMVNKDVYKTVVSLKRSRRAKLVIVIMDILFCADFVTGTDCVQSDEVKGTRKMLTHSQTTMPARNQSSRKTDRTRRTVHMSKNYTG